MRGRLCLFLCMGVSVGEGYQCGRAFVAGSIGVRVTCKYVRACVVVHACMCACIVPLT